MSASVTHLPTSRNWLPMPTGIGVDDSFSRDLLRQFDRRRSRIHVEMAQLENRHSIHVIPITPSPTSSTSRSTNNQNGRLTFGSTPENGLESSEQQDDEDDEEEEDDDDNDEKIRQRSSAGNLLRRSSAYLRAKWRILRSEESNYSTCSLPSPPSKIAINTTISIPHFHHLNNQQQQQQQQQQQPLMNYTIVQPPVITQYPPKPLVYAPVELIEDLYQEDHQLQQQSNSHHRQQQHKSLHRISLPILNTNRNKSLIDKKKKRRFSDSVDQQPQQQHRSLSSCDTIGQRAKKWTQFINCRPFKKSRTRNDNTNS
ncbi:hypothetical protein INT45_007325 [Circinella minor]|uniref:Uncharacterized protein n=1 Tax=Circinella minor TaxID=1195481 RepID=A0A8H7S223_9FUNG|nr:hypothetical protein INT45_007325 [Circinella minor]